jgi:hypothetical protein
MRMSLTYNGRKAEGTMIRAQKGKPRYAVALALVGLCLIAFVSPAIAMDCEEDSISDVSGSGAVLGMLSGHIYEVDDADRVDSELWLGAEDVLVCASTIVRGKQQITIYKIINKDEDGEEVAAIRLE